MEINEENCKLFGKVYNKQNNLLTLTVPCEKKSCLIRNKKKNTKP